MAWLRNKLSGVDVTTEMVVIEILLYSSLAPGVVFGSLRIEASHVGVEVFEEMDIRNGISRLSKLERVV